MRLGDYVTDAIWAVAILAANFALVFLAVFVFATFIQPGEPPEFYQAAAPGIAGWTAPVGGGILFLIVSYLRAARNSHRSALIQAISMWAFYVLLDISLGFALAAGAAVLSLQLALSLGIALTGSLIGARLASARH